MSQRVSLLLVATRVVSVFETVGLNSPLRSRAGGFPPSPAPPRAQAAALQRPHFIKLKSYKYTSSQHTKFNIHRTSRGRRATCPCCVGYVCEQRTPPNPE